ncbi:MAG TPA: hypothetical protein IGP91_05750 [Thermosynechococcus sp. M46_R2017_013]|nr:hypothetical protein [Thermosynechococcus sp. M46_R2017_013]
MFIFLNDPRVQQAYLG